MSDELAVWAEDIRKSFGPAEAVRGVSLAVPKGMIYGVLGPNGAGKTTTLRMLLGVIDPDSGRRTLLGTDAPRSIRERLGYLPEERGLSPNMTAREANATPSTRRSRPCPRAWHSWSSCWAALFTSPT